MSLTVQVSGTDVSVSQAGTAAVTVSSTGIIGATGATGAQGIQGTTGSQGLQGLQGVQGTQGIQGNNGTGTQGIQGTSGTGTQGIQGTQGTSGASDWNSISSKPAGLVSGSSQINGTQITNNSIALGNTGISLGNTPSFPFYINGVSLTDSTATGSFTGSFRGDGSGLTGITGTSTFPYSGTAQITGSLEILNTGSNAITTTSDGGIKVVRHSSAFGFPNTAWGGYLYPLVARSLYTQAGSTFGTTKNPVVLQPLSTAQDIALATVNHGVNVFVSASNEIYLGFGSNSPAKNYVRDLLVMSGSLQGSVSPLTITSSTASLNMSASNFFTLQLAAGSNTHVNVSGQQPGQTVNLRINTGGSGTVTFNSAVKQASGSSYTPTAGTGVDIVSLIAFDSTDVYLANAKNLI